MKNDKINRRHVKYKEKVNESLLAENTHQNEEKKDKHTENSYRFSTK